MKRVFFLFALLAATAALAPAAAQARPSIVVEAAAKGYFDGFEQMAVRFECSAAEISGQPVRLTRCSFGPLNAPTSWCFECIHPPITATTGGGTVVLGQPYSLCVTASSGTSTGWQSVSKCAPYNYTTGTAVVAG